MGIPLLFVVMATVPTVPLVLIALAIAGPGGGAVVALVYLLVMRKAQQISKNDPYRLRQTLRRHWTRWKHRADIRAWGSVTFSPFKRH